jgi:hypothetical protein
MGLAASRIIKDLHIHYPSRPIRRQVKPGCVYPKKTMTSQLVSRRAWLAAAAALLPLRAATRRTLAGIEFEWIEPRPGARRYLLIHGNEQTARDTLLAHMKRAPGRALLVTGAERWVTLRGLRLDPNRMFSREGAARSFAGLNPDAPAARIHAALDWLDGERPALLDALLPPAGGLLVALHNNLTAYSVESEIGISDSVWLPTRGTPHDFMLTTSEADFDILSRSPFNTVLQKRAPQDDDGSLSRLCAARGIRYVNIEARLGHAAEQREMLGWLEQHLP